MMSWILFPYVCTAHDDEEQDVESTEADRFHSFFHRVRLMWSCKKTHKDDDYWHMTINSKSSDMVTVGVSVDWSEPQTVGGETLKHVRNNHIYQKWFLVKNS